MHLINFCIVTVKAQNKQTSLLKVIISMTITKLNTHPLLPSCIIYPSSSLIVDLLIFFCSFYGAWLEYSERCTKESRIIFIVKLKDVSDMLQKFQVLNMKRLLVIKTSQVRLIKLIEKKCGLCGLFVYTENL